MLFLDFIFKTLYFCHKPAPHPLQTQTNFGPYSASLWLQHCRGAGGSGGFKVSLGSHRTLPWKIKIKAKRGNDIIIFSFQKTKKRTTKLKPKQKNRSFQTRAVPTLPCILPSNQSSNPSLCCRKNTGVVCIKLRVDSSRRSATVCKSLYVLLPLFC